MRPRYLSPWLPCYRSQLFLDGADVARAAVRYGGRAGRQRHRIEVFPGSSHYPRGIVSSLPVCGFLPAIEMRGSDLGDKIGADLDWSG